MEPAGLDRRFAAALLAAALMEAVFFLWIGQSWGGADVTQAVDDITLTAVPLAAGALCIAAARRHGPPARASWILLGLACVSWGAGGFVWTYHELALQDEVPFPSWADVGYLGFIPLAAAALLRFPAGPATRTLRARFVLDGALIACAVFFTSWALVLGPVYRGSDGPVLDRAIGLAYPLGDAVVATLVFLVASQTRVGGREPLALVGGGLLALALADSAFAVLTTTGTYATGALIDVGWLVGFLLIALAALWRPQESSQAHRSSSATPGRTGLLAPYVPVVVATGVAAWVEVRRGTLEPVLFWTAVALVVAILVRQLLTLLENLRLTRGLETAYQDLRRAERSRLQLLNNVAHDIASPLTPIKLQLRILESAPPGRPAPRESLAIMQRSVAHLERQVLDLKDLARLEAGQLRLAKRPVDVRDLAVATAESFRDVAKERGVHLETRMAGPLPVVADPDRLTQVLVNLVTNALKFTPAGGRVVVRGTNGGADVRLSVEDTGPGLTSDQIARLFRPFSQVHAPGSAPEKGSGLGLFISRGIVERHGGRIWCESPGPGRGSAFRLALPAAAAGR